MVWAGGLREAGWGGGGGRYRRFVSLSRMLWVEEGSVPQKQCN